MFRTWRLKDVCLTPSIPSFEEVHVEKIFDHLFPCAIMSPLDCFWEGSKLLGPDYPVRVPGLPHLNVKWTNLHPESLFSMLKGMESLSSFPFESFHEIMKRVSWSIVEMLCIPFSPFSPFLSSLLLTPSLSYTLTTAHFFPSLDVHVMRYDYRTHRQSCNRQVWSSSSSFVKRGEQDWDVRQERERAHSVPLESSPPLCLTVLFDFSSFRLTKWRRAKNTHWRTFHLRSL